MNAVRMRAHGCAGASLLEVLVAVSLLAVSVLGVAAAQLAALRDADAQARRMHAAWVAASIVEAMRAPERVSFVLTRSHAYAAAALRGASLSIVDEAADVSAVAVRWTPAPSALDYEQLHGRGGGACAATEGNAPTSCVALPFASRER